MDISTEVRRGSNGKPLRYPYLVKFHNAVVLAEVCISRKHLSIPN